VVATAFVRVVHALRRRFYISNASKLVLGLVHLCYAGIEVSIMHLES
jgi:hypothetical protein